MGQRGGPDRGEEVQRSLGLAQQESSFGQGDLLQGPDVSARTAARPDQRDGGVRLSGSQVGVGVGDGAPAGQHRREVTDLGHDGVQPRCGGGCGGGYLAGDGDADSGDAQSDPTAGVGARSAQRAGGIDGRRGRVELALLELGHGQRSEQREGLRLAGPAPLDREILCRAGAATRFVQSTVDHVQEGKMSLGAEFGQAQTIFLATDPDRGQGGLGRLEVAGPELRDGEVVGGDHSVLRSGRQVRAGNPVEKLQQPPGGACSQRWVPDSGMGDP